jgi:hypothetical protein
VAVCAIVASMAWAARIAHAQWAIGAPPFYTGIFVTPIPGAPFSGEAQAEATRTLTDGNSFDRKRIERIARDSRGRIYAEGHQNVPLTSSQEPPLMIIHIYDPETRMNLLLDPYTHVARQRTLPGPPNTVPPYNWAQLNATFTPADQNVQLEDLGTSVMQGMDVHGYRRSVTLTQKVSGTPQPIVVTDEYWYSQDLRINLMVKHTDPRTGVLTVTVTKLDRVEPSAEMFDVPPGYKVVDMTPPARPAQ